MMKVGKDKDHLERFKIQHFQAEIKIISTCLLFYLVIFLLLFKFDL